MKLISKLCLVALILMFSFSCSSDDDNGNNSLSEEEFKAKIVGVWQIFSVIEDGEEFQNEGCITNTTFEFTENKEFLADYSVDDDTNSEECVESSVEDIWLYLGDSRIESPAFEQVTEIQFEGDNRMLLPSPETEEDPYTQVLVRVQ
jgi:hypothetical protein